MLIEFLGLQDTKMADFAFRYHVIIKVQRYTKYKQLILPYLHHYTREYVRGVQISFRGLTQ